jgi:hypothetical protein
MFSGQLKREQLYHSDRAPSHMSYELHACLTNFTHVRCSTAPSRNCASGFPPYLLRPQIYNGMLISFCDDITSAFMPLSRAQIYACIHTYIHTYKHTYGVAGDPSHSLTYTYVHTYIHTYEHSLSRTGMHRVAGGPRGP